MGIAGKNGDAGHLTISVGFAGLHHKGCGVFDAPQLGTTPSAFSPIGVSDLAEGLPDLGSVHYRQRLFRTHVIEAFEQAVHQRVGNGG